MDVRRGHTADSGDSASQKQATANQVYLHARSYGLVLMRTNTFASFDVGDLLARRLRLQIWSFSVELILRGHGIVSLGYASDEPTDFGNSPIIHCEAAFTGGTATREAQRLKDVGCAARAGTPPQTMFGFLSTLRKQRLDLFHIAGGKFCACNTVASVKSSPSNLANSSAAIGLWKQ